MAQTFNPSSTMNSMMITNHIMNHFNNFHKNKNSSNTEFLSGEFMNETYMIIAQILIVSIFTGFSTYFSNYLSEFMIFTKRIFNKFVFRLIFNPIYKIFTFLLNFILRKQKKYRIKTNISLITSSLRKNSELLEIIQWYLTSDYCERQIPKDQINASRKEIYYMQTNKPLCAFDYYNQEKINFSVGPIMGTEIVVKFKNTDITIYSERNKVEINADVDSVKRDNITYYLEADVLDENSNIFEEFCENAVRTYNKYREEWKQMISHNNGCSWEEPQSINAPCNVDSVILRTEMKNNFMKIMDFFLNNRSYYVEHGQRYKKIILFMGNPGTGKTTLATAFAKQYKKSIFSLNLDSLKREGDLKKLIDNIDAERSILIIDDIDHFFVNKDTTTSDNTSYKKDSEDNSNEDNDDYNIFNDENNNRRVKKEKKSQGEPKYKPSMHELLSFFDGLNTKDGLIVIMCANDPSKIFKTETVEDLALLRDQRINIVCEFKLCNHQMIRDLYCNIFNDKPDEEKILKIEEDYYAPCTISKHFVSFYEKNGGNISDKKEELNKLLEDLINKNLETNRELIVNYSRTYNQMNKQKLL